MLLDSLKDFSWDNEPANVRFDENGMVVETEPETDFWQSLHHNIHKDNGHFFFTRKRGDFNLEVHWHFEQAAAADQCGIMLRVDSLNWAKAGFLSSDLRIPQLGSVVTLNGVSDWAAWPLVSVPQDIWLKTVRKGKDFLIFASIDGQNFRQLRMFALPGAGSELKAGAYICSPQKHNFSAALAGID